MNPIQRRVMELDRTPHNGARGILSYETADGRKYGGQLAILHAAIEHPFVMACFGRSSGKSMTGPTIVVGEGALCRARYEHAFCTPFNDGARDAYRAWKQVFRDWLTGEYGLRDGHDDVGLLLHVGQFGANQGAVIDFFGLENHDALRRYRKHRLHIDEGKDVRREAVYSTLRPMLLGRSSDGIQGGVLVTYTPSRVGVGSEWTKEAYLRGLRRVDGYCTVKAPSHCNPFLTDAEIAQLIAERTDEASVREEIQAEHLEDEGQVFTNLGRVFTVPVLRRDGPLWIGEEPDRGEGAGGRRPDRYVGGYDAAAAKDWDVYSGFNERTRRQAWLMRLPGSTSIAEKRMRVEQVRRYFNRADVIYDATGGYGLAVAGDAAREQNSGWIPRTWDWATKESDVTIARWLCERAGNDSGPAWAMLDVPEQRAEFESYKQRAYDRDGKPLRTRSYGAPHGEHDDMVSAACLVAERLNLPHPVEMQPEAAPDVVTALLMGTPEERHRKIGPLSMDTPAFSKRNLWR